MVRKRRGDEIVPQTDMNRPMNLFSELDRMFEDMDSWFWGPSLALTPRMANDRLRSPRVNVQDAGDKFILTAEMPGVSKDNLDLNIHDNVLEIGARKNVEIQEEDEKTGYIYREMRSNSFHRQIPFGQDIVPEECDAELENGILTVNLKKREMEENIHTIAVK